MNITTILNSDMSINHHRGFSLVEVLAAVAIIGIITFLAMPNIVAVKQDSENNLAISRAEAINIALVTFIQTNGHNNATNYWNQSSSDQHRYSLLATHMAFAPAIIENYMPMGYTLQLPSSIDPLKKVSLIGPSGEILY